MLLRSTGLSLTEGERLAKLTMAVLISTLQLLFLGALISPVYLLDACELIQNTTHLGSFNLSVIPDDYKADTNYSGKLTLSGSRNFPPA